MSQPIPKVDDNPLRDSINNFRTLSLFLETNTTDLEPLFTLKDDDYRKEGKLYKSMKRIYLSYNDPTEWDFVQDVLGNWRHWERLCNNKIIRSYIDQWRLELEIKLRSQGVRNLYEASGKKADAAKWFAEGAWKGKRGRPSKDEVEREKRVQAGIEQDLDSHWQRLMTGSDEQTKPN